MPSLREILDKQKAERLNASRGQSTIHQTEPVKPETQSEQKDQALPTETNIAGRRLQEAGGSDRQENIALLPPAGLTGLALIRWKKEHAVQLHGNSTDNAIKDTTKPIPEKAPVQQDKIAAIPEPIENKKNDGKIDTDELRRNLTYLANNIEQKELVGQVVRTIAQQLKNSPELTPYMSDADVDLVVRGLRRAYGVAARKKSEAKEKRESKTKGTEDIAQMFKDAGLGDLNLGLKL